MAHSATRGLHVSSSGYLFLAFLANTEYLLKKMNVCVCAYVWVYEHITVHLSVCICVSLRYVCVYVLIFYINYFGNKVL